MFNKKLFSFMAISVLCVMLFACSNQSASNIAEGTTIVETKKEEQKTDKKDAEKETTKYKDTLVSFDKLTQGKKLLLLQNTLIYSRDGFYKEDTAPKVVEIDFESNKTSAYPIEWTTKLLLEPINGDVKVTNTKNEVTTVSGNDFNGMYVILGDLSEGKAPVLFNPNTNTTIKDFKFAIMPDGEAIYSIVADNEKNIQDILREVNWNPDRTYRMMATDYFYIPLTKEETKTGVVKGTLSGAINANIPDVILIKNGKINDIMYFEEMEMENASN